MVTSHEFYITRSFLVLMETTIITAALEAHRAGTDVRARNNS